MTREALEDDPELDETPPSSPSISPIKEPDPQKRSQAAVQLLDQYMQNGAPGKETDDILGRLERLLDREVGAALSIEQRLQLAVRLAESLAVSPPGGHSLEHRVSAQNVLEVLLPLFTGAHIGHLMQQLLHHELHEVVGWASDDGIEHDSEWAGFGEFTTSWIGDICENNKMGIDLLTIAKPMLGSENWQTRFAGLRGVGSANEHDDYRKTAGYIDLVLPLLADRHPRVRNKACGFFKDNLSPPIETKWRDDEEHVKTILPVLLKVLEDTCDRVAAHAALVIGMYYTPDLHLVASRPVISVSDVVLPHCLSIMAAVECILQRNVQRMMKERKVACIAAMLRLFEKVGEEKPSLFKEFYARIAGPLKYILMAIPTGTAEGPIVNLGQALFSIFSRIGSAVEKRRFRSDAAKIAVFVDVAAADPAIFHVLLRVDGFSTDILRLADVLGRKFVPFLPRILSALIEHLRGKKHIRGRETKKQEAAKLLPRLCEEYTEHLGPFVESLVAVARASRSTQSYDVESGRWAYEIVPPIIKYLVMTGNATLAHSLWIELYGELQAVINSNVKQLCLSDALRDIGEALVAIGVEGASAVVLVDMGGQLRGLLDTFDTYREPRQYHGHPPHLREYYSAVTLLSNACKTILSVTKVVGGGGSDPMLTPDQHTRLGARLESFLRKGAPYERLRAASAVGDLALANSPAFNVEFVTAVLNSLLAVVQVVADQSDCDFEEIRMASENSLSAASKILRIFPAMTQKGLADKVRASLVDYVHRHVDVEDKSECEEIYSQFASIVEAGDDVVCEQQSKALGVITKALYRDLISDTHATGRALLARLIEIGKRLARDEDCVREAALSTDETETMRKVLKR